MPPPPWAARGVGGGRGPPSLLVAQRWNRGPARVDRRRDGRRSRPTFMAGSEAMIPSRARGHEGGARGRVVVLKSRLAPVAARAGRRFDREHWSRGQRVRRPRGRGVFGGKR